MAFRRNLAHWRRRLSQLGPGLITGAADDDPSGIATYSQAGAQFGFGMAWTLVFTYPLMTGIQMVSARLGCLTGKGLAANIRDRYPRPVLLVLVGLLVVANVINIAADLAAMGEALRLIAGGAAHVYVVSFGLLCLVLQVFLPYAGYVQWLKWLTLALLSYVAVVFSVHVPWGEVARGLVWPRLSWDGATVTMVVAVFGTTISPYLFFWQAAQEVEDLRAAAGGGDWTHSAAEVRRHLRRIRWDTFIGMGFSNLIALFIMLSTGATLYAAGVRDIQTSAQAAEALRPVAGEAAFLVFGLGIIGTGLLAVPVLAGSAAYAVTEAMAWRGGLDLKLQRGEGKRFYTLIAVATVGGVLLDFSPADPIKELFWSAVINGVIAVPIMVVLMLLGGDREVMGGNTIGARLRWLGWLAAAAMAASVVAMFVLW
ncbi:NRAMP family divalent metal transporter [Methylibium sp.]|uniref:NRAMP family divalent metal transporter n=1 Tax=Methylibium sp. TaxID=2067992 RepID=UPI003D0C6E13